MSIKKRALLWSSVITILLAYLAACLIAYFLTYYYIRLSPYRLPALPYTTYNIQSAPFLGTASATKGNFISFSLSLSLESFCFKKRILSSGSLWRVSVSNHKYCQSNALASYYAIHYLASLRHLQSKPKIELLSMCSGEVFNDLIFIICRPYILKWHCLHRKCLSRM